MEMKKNALCKLKPENPKRLKISHININSTKNKFDCIFAFSKNEVNILAYGFGS